MNQLAAPLGAGGVGRCRRIGRQGVAQQRVAAGEAQQERVLRRHGAGQRVGAQQRTVRDVAHRVALRRIPLQRVGLRESAAPHHGFLSPIAFERDRAAAANLPEGGVAALRPCRRDAEQCGRQGRQQRKPYARREFHALSAGEAGEELFDVGIIGEADDDSAAAALRAFDADLREKKRSSCSTRRR